jgi:N-acetylglucosaminyl-diphospho-decaprenol L-rhamnosyltransferase
MSSPRVAVVTVTYNSGDQIGPFLESVERASTGPVDVVVVDNASPQHDDTRATVDERGASFLLLDDNRGYGGGINAGARTVSPDVEFLLISNPDVVLEPGSIDALVDILDRHPEAGAAGPRILTEEGEIYPSARELPSLSSGAGHALFSRIWPSNPWTQRYHNERIDTGLEASVGWLSGACVLIRRAAFERVGGFDESFFMYFEDVDLGRRLREAGFENRYVPAATVVHRGARSTSQNPVRMLTAHHSSAYLYLSRRYPRWYQAPLRGLLRLGLWVRLRWNTRSSRSSGSSGASGSSHSSHSSGAA